VTADLNPAQRAASLAAATSGTHDVIVVGGGVTGAGAALDAALRGLSVVLVEAGDLAAGTSSRSGKTFHGGLRYLEQLNFSLVRSALKERDLMVDVICPHLASPEPFLYPLTRRWERPYVGAGIALYDLMASRRSRIPRHRHYTRAGALRLAPALDPATITGAIRYFDVRVDDARHTMTVARTAARFGAHILTRMPVVDVVRTGGATVHGVLVEDSLTGRRHEILGRVVVNAAGVWAAKIQSMAQSPTFAVRPAKGVHLVIPNSAIDSESGILARADDSVLVIRKWFDHWIIGTTDTAWDRDLGAPVADGTDIDYLLNNTNRYLRRKLTRHDLVGVYAGLRPLLAPVNKDTATTSALSRDHSVIRGPAGMVTVVGGKYTTYRLMAADAIEAAARQMGRTVPASSTATQPLIGAEGWHSIRTQAASRAAGHGIDAAQTDRMLGRYGDRIVEVLDLADESPTLAQPVAGLPGYVGAEVVHSVTAEGAMTVEDVLQRRSHGAIETSDAGATAAAEVARLMAGPMEWDEREQDKQVRAYISAVHRERVAL
jgi:glycerol-3-phosphate dehydrogenase